METPPAIAIESETPLRSATTGEVSSLGAEHIPFRLVLCLIGVTFLLFINTLNQYFLLDDFEVIYSAKYNSLWHVLLGHDTVLEYKFFRPIPMFFTWVLYKAFGALPFVYHALSVLLHAGVAVAAANLAYLLSKDLKQAALFALVFIAFPNHAEVVDWPAITFTTWAALFFLLSLNLFAYHRLHGRPTLLILSLVCFLAATLSKEDSFTLPAVIVVFDFIFSRLRKLKYSIPRQGAVYSLYFLLLVCILLITRVSMKLGTGYLTVEGDDIIALYMNSVWVLLSDWLRMTLGAWRFVLAPIDPAFSSSKYLTFGILLLLLVSICILLVKRRIPLAPLVFSFLFACITSLPVMGTFRVLPLTQWVRFLYLPSLGGCYIVALVLGGIMSSWTRPRGRLAVAAVVFAPMIFLTKYYDHQWIKAQQETKQVMKQVSAKIALIPPYSRVYVEGIPWTTDEIPRIDYAFPAAVGLYYDRSVIQAGLPFLPANKVLALDREDYSKEVAWSYFRLNMDSADKSPADITPVESDTPAFDYWDFSKPFPRRFLGAVNGLVPVKPDSHIAYPVGKIEGPWSLLWLPPVNPDRPVEYVKVELMLTGNGGTDICRLFWISEDDLEITGGKSIGFFAVADGQFHEYTIPLYRNGLAVIHPRLLRFAMRPSQKIGTIFSLKELVTQYY